MIILKLPLQSMIGNIRQFISETKGNQFYILVYLLGIFIAEYSIEIFKKR